MTILCGFDCSSLEKLKWFFYRSGAKNKTEDGFEVIMGTNYFGHVYLTEQLLDRMTNDKSKDYSRIITVSSEASFFAKFNPQNFDLNMTGQKYNSDKQYCRSKLAQMMYTTTLAKRLKDSNIAAMSLSPGIC